MGSIPITAQTTKLNKAMKSIKFLIMGFISLTFAVCFAILTATTKTLILGIVYCLFSASTGAFGALMLFYFLVSLGQKNSGITKSFRNDVQDTSDDKVQ